MRKIGLLFILSFFTIGILNALATPDDWIQGLQWRLLGPLRAGWSSCAEGIPNQPDVYYFGAVDGGVWKTTDAGVTWQPISDTAPFSSVGALAIADGNPRTIYVGSGQVAPRYDIMDGNGVFKSEDDGRTWVSLGLTESRHIGRIRIDPRDPKIILVAALGHVFGPHPERGVFRSDDGGATWEKVLFVDENTGAVDLASDPATPDIVYAALWSIRRYPWQAYFTPVDGPGSGIWKSTDGGKTWAQTSRQGLPKGALSRIGLAVAPGTQGQRVYASVTAEERGGFYRSDDGGATWRLMNDDRALATWYFGRVTTDPNNPDVVYMTGVSLRQSEDGGKTFTIIKGAPGGDDYHFYWIHPQHPDHSILATDQGTTVTVNGGKTWSPWYNQATGQFYHLGADNRFPYWVYSAQQDSGTVRIATRSDYGQLTFRDWHPVGGDERDYDLPHPKDPDIVFGSGLGGRLSRWDARNGRVTNVSPWPISSYGARPTTVKYRYTWITPIAISPRPPHAIYQGAQVLFRSLDMGHSWETITPDLTGTDPKAKDCKGDVPVSRATACGYGVIFSIAPSPIQDGLIWFGTDNGRVFVSQDDGKTWNNVTPADVTDWSKIASIDASPTSANTAYIAVDRHRLDDRRPYIYRTHDFGKTWQAIANGIPENTWVNVVRQDLERPGLLYAGTRNGVFVSLDDGEHWTPLQLNLPRSGVNDLLAHGSDLIAATQGRSIWILDNVTPLRYLNPSASTMEPVLVPPQPAVRISKNENRDTPLPPEMPTTPNPPVGAVIDYFLPDAPLEPIVLEILNENADIVRVFRSDDNPVRPEANRYFAESWLHPLPVLSSHAGHNRFVWDLHSSRPLVPEYDYSIAAVPFQDIPALPEGILAVPGKYTVRLTVDGKTTSRPLKVEMDPRSSTRLEDLAAQFSFYSEVTVTLKKVTEMTRSLEAINHELAKATDAKSKKKMEKLDQILHSRDPGSLSSIANALTSLAVDLEQADGPPTMPQRALYREYEKALQSIQLPK